MLKEPASAEECVYFTNRSLGEKGEVMCWVFRKTCPKCNKTVMGKPKDKKGKVSIRAKEYVCPNCGYKEEKKQYEESLTASIRYACPKCSHKDETQLPFRRKKIEGVDALVFSCQKCQERILVTKKMKEVGEKEE